MLPHHRPITLICPLDDLENLVILYKACQQREQGQRPWQIWVTQEPTAKNLDTQYLRRLILSDANNTSDLSNSDQARWQLQPPLAASQCPLADSDDTVIVCVECDGEWLRQQWPANPWLTLDNGSYHSDHRNDATQPAAGKAAAQRQSLTTLEQFAHLTGDTLNATEMSVAINDHQYLPGLSRIGLSFEQAVQLRQAEMWIKGYRPNPAAASGAGAGLDVDVDVDDTISQILAFAGNIHGLLPAEIATAFPPSDWLKCGNTATEKEKQTTEKKNTDQGKWAPSIAGLGLAREFCDITFLLAPAEHLPLFLDNLQLAYHQQEYRRAAHNGRPLTLENWLIFYIDEPVKSAISADSAMHKVRAIEFSGSSNQGEFIHSLINNPHYRMHFRMEANRDPDSDYLRIESKSRDGNLNQPAMQDLISDLLQVIIKTSHPLRNYSLDLLFPLQNENDSDIYAQPPAIHTGFLAGTEGNNDDCAWSVQNVVLTLNQEGRQHRGINPPDPEIDTPHKEPKEQEKHNKEVSFLSEDKQTLFTNYQEYDSVYEYLDASLRHHILESSASAGKQKERPIREYLLSQTRTLDSEDDHGVLGLFLKSADQSPHVLARITKLRIYEYYNQERVFSISIAPVWDTQTLQTLHSQLKTPGTGNFSIDSDNTGWWTGLVFSSPEDLRRLQHMQLNNWLIFTEAVRNLYNPIRYTANEVHKDNRVAWQSSGDFNQPDDHPAKSNWQQNWVKQLLLRFFPTASHSDDARQVEAYLDAAIQQYPDNRMFVNVAYTLAGPSPDNTYSQASDHQMFSLAAFVDHKGYLIDNHRYAYNPDFVSNLLSETSFTRWQGITYNAAFNDYANVYLGYGWFSAHQLTKHIRYIYLRLLLVALFYRSTIRQFSRTISHKGQMLRDADIEGSNQGKDPYQEFRQIRSDFIDFTNLYWFKNISHMVQAKEIFALQTKGLEIDNEYEFVKEEMSWADSYIESKQAQHAEENATRLNHIAALFALLALGLQIIALEDNAYAPTKILDSIALVLFCVAGMVLFIRGETTSGFRLKRLSRWLKKPAIVAVIVALLATLAGTSVFYARQFDSERKAEQSNHHKAVMSDDRAPQLATDIDRKIIRKAPE